MESTPRSCGKEGSSPPCGRSRARAATPAGVKATDIGRLHPAIEATAYYIAAEATATPSSTRAHQVEITLARTPQALQRTITDDGAGGAAISGGTGLQGLHDRADAVGGHITLISPAGGPTLLTARLPILGPLTER